MSLIDEALKRARHEASRQEAVKRDAARHDGPRPIPKLYAERRASRAPVWAGIATGAAVALLGVIAWLLWGRPPVAPPIAPVVVAEIPAAPSAPVPTAAVPLSPPAATLPPKVSAPAPRVADPKPAPVAAPATPTAVPPAATVAPTPSRELPDKPSVPPTAPVKSSVPRSPSAGAVSTAATQTYVREVALPGGGPHFRLGGIAYSEEAPIALINGAALGRGEVVEGYVVRRIDAAEVELEGPAGRVVLRLK